MSYVTAVYRTVVDDVIQKVKDDFIQDGYESVLVELQTLWETKLMQTGALNVNRGPHNPMPPGSAGGYALDPFAGQGAQGGLLQGGEYVGDGYLPAQGGQQFDSVLGRPQRFMPQTWAGQDPSGVPGERVALPYATAAGGQAGAGAELAPAGGAGAGGFSGLLAGGEGQAVGAGEEGRNVLGKRKAPEAEGTDGSGGVGAALSVGEVGPPGTGGPPPPIVSPPALDDLGYPGAGPAKPAPAGGAGGDALDPAGKSGTEKDPGSLDLNDIGDDDDEEPDAKDIVLAQFEKVTRSKNKWKCTLLDGIMHVNGRDYLFQRAQGEFQW